MNQDASGKPEAAEPSQATETESDPSLPDASNLQPEDEATSPAPQVAPADNSEVAKISKESSAPVSQPMTASTSTSSNNASLKDAGIASPYGTRSRNRGGGSRPNYAEDREMETDFEIQTSSKEDESRKIPRLSEQRQMTSSDAVGTTLVSRRLATTQPDYNNGGGQSGTKDHIPGTSTFSANPAASASAQVSKKRKAASNPGATQLHSQPFATASTIGGQTVTRRASVAAQTASGYRDSSMLSFDNCSGHLKEGKLVADDGTTLGINDHVYLVCEPPGEPYYLGRIMEFLHVNNDPSKPVDALRMNWYYRPKDIGRKVSDTRQVFASMHSDVSPLTALRGLCDIRHKSEIRNLDEFRWNHNSFWYEKLYDRYIHRYYEVIPTIQVVNVPAKVRKVLHDRWKFILVESGRGKELTSAVKSCKRCSGYCASNDSVDCAVCRSTYHMNCVRPPLLKKPSRGFAWACGPCSRAQERKLEARNTPNLTDTGLEAEDEEFIDEEDEEVHATVDGGDTGRTSPALSTEADISIHPGTAEQIYQASLWPFRYLGVHCKVEDALDYDDRIYPRASSRLGPRHQANVASWPGRPVELVKPAEMKRKYVKGGAHKKETKLSKETVAAIELDKVEREKRPKHVIDEPQGYVPRGEDFANDDPNSTAELLFKPPEPQEITTGGESVDAVIDVYMTRAKELAKPIGVPTFSVNFLDKALELLCSSNFDMEVALDQLARIEKHQLKEPELTAAEVKKFEDGVSKFGSELHSVKKHVKTVTSAEIVRFYYTWKKTERGRQIWGNYSGRKGKKEAKKAEANVGKLQDDVADDHDDSAFDNEKAAEKKRGFMCKFCTTRSSRQWRRAPNTPAGTTVPTDPNNKVPNKDKSGQLMVALCLKCAYAWRRYAVQRDPQDIEEYGKKAAPNGGRPKNRKADDPMREFQLIDQSWTAENTDVATTPTSGTPVPPGSGTPSGQEPARKKAKNGFDKDQSDHLLVLDPGIAASAGQQKRKQVEKQAGPPPLPEMPRPKTLPCVICLQMEPLGEQHLSCRECRLTVHRNCYGISEARSQSKWVCDMCSNDRNPQVSIQYKCMLCPVDFTEHDFVEPLKPSHKKKTEKDREKDRIEREGNLKAAEFYRKKQEEMNRPLNPREPLKRTANNNWVHVVCAVWTPEVKFGNAKALEPSEGIPSIASVKYDEFCKVCKKQGGACVACHSCRAPVHVGCAHAAGYILGFDIAPVKGSRRDQFNIVNINGEAGTMTAAIWCKDHTPTKTIVHRMYDIVDDDTGLNALQLYVQNFKQADLTLTGTVRKATLINQSTKAINATPLPYGPNRRTSTTTILSNGGRGSISHVKVDEASSFGNMDLRSSPATSESPTHCLTCAVDVSPKWWPYALSASSPAPPKSSESETNNSRPGIPSSGSDLAVINGHIGSGTSQGIPKQHVALATAALDGNTQKSEFSPTDVQCHKCHWNKVRKAPTSPVQPTPPQQDVAQVHPPAPLATISAPSLASPPPMSSGSRYAWTQPRAYSPPRAYGDWSRASPAPLQPSATLHHFNGNHSPPGGAQPGHHLNSQSHSRQSTVGLAQSPHMSGSITPQSTNGFAGSPQRSLSGTHQLQTGSFVSYASTRPSPQHLINGGPPPRAAENPFSQSAHQAPFRSQYGSSHGSPPASRGETPVMNRDSSGQSNGSRGVDGRVNGGASASPSLQNLLS